LHNTPDRTVNSI